MYSSQLKVSLLSLSVLLAISSPAVLAAKLTIEQRLELLESELSANKKENGFYVLTAFQIDGTRLIEVEGKLNINENLMKYMIVKND